MSAYSPRPEDFAPLGAQNAAPVLVRPSLSYWADARARLLRNPRALGSWCSSRCSASLPPSARCSGPWTRPRRTSTASPSPRIWARKRCSSIGASAGPGSKQRGGPLPRTPSGSSPQLGPRCPPRKGLRSSARPTPGPCACAGVRWRTPRVIVFTAIATSPPR